MKVLIYGAGVLGSLFAARLHEAGHDVSLLARGKRLDALNRHGVQLAREDSPSVKRIPVPIVAHPSGEYDLIAVVVRAHQVDEVLKSLINTKGDVLFLLNWAAGIEPLGEVIGYDRVLFGFPTSAGTMDGDVVRYRATDKMTRMFPMPIGEPDGRTTPRLKRIVQAFRTTGIHAKAVRKMDAYLKTHAAFEVPLVHATSIAGGPKALANDKDAIHHMIRHMQKNLTVIPTALVPRGFVILKILPGGLLATLFRLLLQSKTVGIGLGGVSSPSAIAERERLSAQLRVYKGNG